METTNQSSYSEAANLFNKIVELKGKVTPIAEKALRNYTYKKGKNNRGEIIYFSIGHAFKNIDKKALFDLEYDSSADKYIPKRFKSLYSPYSNVCFQSRDSHLCPPHLMFCSNKDALEELIENIRNLNSHYVHNFDELNVSKHQSLIEFIIESFEVAAIMSYTKYRKISLESYYNANDRDSLLVSFLKDLFFPTNDKRKYNDLSVEDKEKRDKYNDRRNSFAKLSIRKAIDELLFINNSNNIEWILDNNHKVFNIGVGKYFSLNAQIFILSMFLYKGEAEKLISKVKGFKRNDDNAHRSKRDIFTFFSKKFGSQDINSEDASLVKFRDIIQYLNHYPTTWNKWLETENSKSDIIKDFENKIIELEINRIFRNDKDNGLFPNAKDNERFIVYAKYNIWEKSILGKQIERDYLNMKFSDDEITSFNEKINVSPELKNASKEYNDIKNDKKRGDISEKIKKLEQEKNPILTKLKNRILEEKIFTSYGRNQDRFMQFACRFLAESNYFGNMAKFKLYEYYTIGEQKNSIEGLKSSLSKKQFDKLKYHQGRIVNFKTFKSHLEKYNNWDTPFVIENNAIQIMLENGVLISIQRALMPYILEHKFNGGNGKTWFEDYTSSLFEEKKKEADALRTITSIEPSKKTELSKIFPKRLLNNYSPAQNDGTNETNPLREILKNAEKAEARYKSLHNKVIDLEKRIKLRDNSAIVTLVEDFEKKNKGKNFKLRFVKKAWHLMYFKDIYNERKKEYKEHETIEKLHEHEKGHHKGLNINKKEYKDFCKWMFALDVADYKNKLYNMLETKGFLDNIEFKELFKSCNDLNEMYKKTKPLFNEWIDNQTLQKTNCSIDSYQHISNPEGHILYINLSHFRRYIEWSNTFKTLENGKYLIKEYYCADPSGNFLKPNNNKTKKFYNELKHQYLEDCFLYEIAMKYLEKDNDIIQSLKSSVADILNKDIIFDIKDSTGKLLYKLSIPFSKLDSYIGIIAHKKMQENDSKNKGSSFLTNLPKYLDKTQLKLDKYAKSHSYKNIKYEHLHVIDSHIIDQSAKFTEVVMSLERYFISKHKIVITKENRIEFNEIPEIKKEKEKDKETYIKEIDRKKAFHFGLPDSPYIDKIKEIESKFIKNEIKTKPNDYNSMSLPCKTVCDVFLNNIHNDFFNKNEKDSQKKRNDAKTEYVSQVISNNI